MRENTKRYAVILGCAALAILAVLGFSLFMRGPAVPAELAGAEVGYQLYYPNSLPTKFEVQKKSIQVSDSLVLFQVTDGSGKKLTVSQQQKPPNYEFES